MKRIEIDLLPYLILGAAITLGGCVAVAGTPSGIRAYGDWNNGMIAEAKASSDATSSAQVTRRVIEQEGTKRYLKPSILDGLFTSHKE